MTPADGAAFVQSPSEVRHFPTSCAILLQGGRALLLFENAASAPPTAGHQIRDGLQSGWAAHCWQDAAEGAEGWHGVAVLDAVPTTESEIVGAPCAGRWRFAAAPELDVAPEPLADLVRRTGASCRDVLAFLFEHLLAGCPADTGEAQSHRRFVRSFVTAAAERDGFIEVFAAPDTGGVFAQGWSMSLAAGETAVASAAEHLALIDVEVAHFDRDDILPPGQGFCLFGKSWEAKDLGDLDAFFFEQDGRLLRLDAVRGSVVLTGAEATAHVALMLPRMRAPSLGAFKRVCRPRFAGEDTLSSTPAPIAAALDAVLRAPDGSLLTIGWLLDPLRRVERMLLKSTESGIYARLDASACPLPRPDLADGFARDPRFGRLLSEWEVMHGFVAHVPARSGAPELGQLYLELVLDDGNCLFQPITAMPFDSAELLPQVLNVLSPAEPELARIVDEHLAPFLASVPKASPRMRRGPGRPIPLGGPCTSDTLAVMPFRSFSELQPVLALLAGTPEADALDFALVTSRGVAAGMVDRLGSAFDFYGLNGCLIVTSENAGLTAQFDLGTDATEAEQVLAWMPTALPKQPGWLAPLLAEHAGLPTGGLLSPALTYEDGSIHFGGVVTGGGTACALSGYGASWMPRGAPKRTPVGAAQVALIERAALAAVGGFSGRLFGDEYAHVDLADRLARAGLGTWCSGAVEFWVLDDHAPGEEGSLDRMIRQIDTALLGRRARALRELAA